MVPSKNRLAMLIFSAALGSLVTFALIKSLRRKRRLPLPSDVAEPFIISMNRNQQRALTLIARHFGGLKNVTAASVVSLDHGGVDLCVTVALDPQPRSIRIDFGTWIGEPQQAGACIADLYRAAAQTLGQTLDAEAEALLRIDPVKDSQYGLCRGEFGKQSLVGTVKKYSTHVFVMSGRASSWPKRVEDGDDESLSLARALLKAVDERKKSLTGKFKVNVCEAVDDDEEGAVLVFPQEVLITGVTLDNVTNVVDAYLVEGSETKLKAVPGVSVCKDLPRSHLFVCAHLRRDKRCGVIGPYVMAQLRTVIKEKGLQCPVRACSHVGGHAYSGNVLAFSRRDEDGMILGDWYGYVGGATARDVVEKHVMQGQVLKQIWRGRMGLSEEEQLKYVTDVCDDCPCTKTDL